MSTELDPRTPVLVGVGVATRREDDPTLALEPLDLMLEAVRTAGEDCGVPGLMACIDRIAVPRGRWSCRNPAGAIAHAIGASGARTIVTSVGVLQQTLVADACEQIASGNADCTLVTGADCGYRLLRARLTGTALGEWDQDDEPDERWEPKAELRHPAERRVGLDMPVGLYAILESARRAQYGESVEDNRRRLAQRGARFAAIAAANPHAWDRSGRDEEWIGSGSDRNPMQAFPYTRAQCSTWNVDQAAALLFCSAELASQLNIPRDRWVFPWASAEANHMVPVSARSTLVGSAGATAAASVLATVMDLPAIDLVDLYSCFPIALDTFADAAGIPEERDLTITGGMSFAGGPYNNYLFQATARAAELLRAGAGRTALLSCVSGIMTKQAFALWSVDPPARRFQRFDVTNDVAAADRPVAVLDQYDGEAVIAGCTVLHARGEAPRAIALLDVPGGARALAVSDVADVVEGMEREEWVGRRVSVSAGRFAV